MKQIAFCIGLALAATSIAPASALDKKDAASPKATTTAKRAPLTTAECTSLGGTVGSGSQKCTDANQFTCTTTTVSASGTVKTNQACIDKK